MRALLLLAAMAALALLAPPAAADPLVDCSGPAGPSPLCHTFWAEVDAGYCLRADSAPDCAAEEATHASCTLDNPPSRCGNRLVGFGFGGPN